MGLSASDESQPSNLANIFGDCPHLVWPDDARKTMNMGKTLGSVDFEVVAPEGKNQDSANQEFAFAYEICRNTGYEQPDDCCCRGRELERDQDGYRRAFEPPGN